MVPNLRRVVDHFEIVFKTARAAAFQLARLDATTDPTAATATVSPGQSASRRSRTRARRWWWWRRAPRVGVCRWVSVGVGGCRWVSVGVGGCRWVSALGLAATERPNAGVWSSQRRPPRTLGCLNVLIVPIVLLVLLVRFLQFPHCPHCLFPHCPHCPGVPHRPHCPRPPPPSPGMVGGL